MGALAVAQRAPEVSPGPWLHAENTARLAQVGLARHLFETARTHPQRTAFRDAGDRSAWCGRPAITWTYATAAEMVGRLARGIGAWRLPAGSRVGLWFAGGTESALAHLAVEAAGHLPCLMPASWDCDRLSAGIEAAGLVAILTEGRRGERRAAEDVARAALRHFGLRYLAAFGPALPDGVISLDAMALERGIAEPGASLGLATFAGGDPTRPVYRDAAALSAAVDAHLHALPVAAGERILTLLPGHDLRGIVTGLGAALAAGATLEGLIPFEEAAFRASLARPVPTRLVIPALFEPALAAIPVSWTVRAIDCVSRGEAVPHPVDNVSPAGPRRLDCMVLGEDVVLTRPRGPSDLAALLRRPEHAALPPSLLILARGTDGGLLARGPACAAAALQRSRLTVADPESWRGLHAPGDAPRNLNRTANGVHPQLSRAC